jgi:sterol desaturase/sphingolipid hydroxylase (fatty acid hydroxylase superfamily)
MLKANPESPRMFESDFVDFFSRTHPAVVPILFVPASSWLLWYSVARAGVGTLATAGLFAGGFLTWTLAEYWLHRTFFHWLPGGVWGERMHFLVHGVHHTWPRDKYRLVMPPAVSISLFWMFLGIFSVVVGRPYMWGFHAGFVAGYMAYDLTHYYIHHFSPRSEYGRTLKKHHMLHHFKDHGARFGVSSRMWDHVFGTLESAQPKATTQDAE